MDKDLEVLDRTGKLSPSTYTRLTVEFRRYAGIFHYLGEMFAGMANRCNELSEDGYSEQIGPVTTDTDKSHTAIGRETEAEDSSEDG